MTSKARQLADLGGDTANLEDISSVLSSGPLSNRNRIINGEMVIDQRNNGAAVTSSFDYITDRFLVVNNLASGTFTAQQSSDAPQGFTKSLKYTSTSGIAPTGGEQAGLRQYVEGFNTADLNWGTANAQSVTLSFWVKSSLTGLFGGALVNDAFDRIYVYSYTINAANTWEYKTVTIAGDTTGTWETGNSSGIRIIWGLGAADFKKAAGSWGAPPFAMMPTGSVNLVETNGATFYLTGVQLEVGSVATPFEHRSYGQELALCQRYFCKIQNTMGGSRYLGMLQAFTSSATYGVIADYPQVMRTVPSVAQGGSFGFYNAASSDAGATTTIGGLQPNNKGWISGGWGGSSVLTAGHASVMWWGDGAYLTADAEL